MKAVASRILLSAIAGAIGMAILSAPAFVLPAFQAIDYREALGTCGKTGPQPLHFIKLFKGQWPIPANFVLIGHSKSGLEYFDGAHLTWAPERSSTLLLRSKESFERLHAELVQGVPNTEQEEHALTVRRFTQTSNGEVTLVSDGREYLVLYGPYQKHIKEALACYRRSMS